MSITNNSKQSSPSKKTNSPQGVAHRPQTSNLSLSSLTSSTILPHVSSSNSQLKNNDDWVEVTNPNQSFKTSQHSFVEGQIQNNSVLDINNQNVFASLITTDTQVINTPINALSNNNASASNSMPSLLTQDAIQQSAQNTLSEALLNLGNSLFRSSLSLGNMPSLESQSQSQNNITQNDALMSQAFLNLGQSLSRNLSKKIHHWKIVPLKKLKK